jgi:hypothetical protein
LEGENKRGGSGGKGVRRGELRRGWVILLNSPVWWIK